ncbi:hypothetical protein GA830_12100 [Mesorhizobium sp. NBSH29]|uniref:hypothetical protein n=1 Tax=Mesorhizobium sp. NBSH29 TaxID=2654249 RepID=UPI0018966861|nr:hypothetical protein [Mesorhizobium sp. NBSH29]QPC87399.1 hypothetical protein GA830_12100 [Mesorhizobium sp. NBSH29]
MMDTRLPIIRQMMDADSDRDRAQVLLQVPDAVLMKYRTVFEEACQRSGFAQGQFYIDIRRACWHAVRAPDGLLRDPMFDQARSAFAAFAMGAGA